MQDLNQYFEAYSEEFEYSLDNNLMLNFYPNRILESKKGESLLELGIGHGYTSNFFSNHFSRHVVIDGSERIVAAYKEKFPHSKSELILEYFEKFESNERFDHIVMGFVLEHVDQPLEILLKFQKYLKPHGSIFVAVPNAEALNKKIGLYAGLISDLHELGPGDIALGHKQLYTVKSLTKQMQDAGLRIVRKEGLFLKPLTTSQIKSLNLSEDILNSFMIMGIDYPELSAALFFEATLK